LPVAVPRFHPVLSITLLSLLFSVFCALLVSKYGSRLALIDNPTVRSSHSLPTPRGGGIGLWITLIIVGIFVTRDFYFSAILSIAGLLGLLEDCFTLSSRFRLLSQFVISSFVALLFLGPPASPSTLSLFLFWLIFMTATTNFYNFMDGINGIAGLTGLVGFGLIAYFSYFILNVHDIFLMSTVLAAGCLGFLPFNFPRARVFMGDVGSIFLGFVFASFVVRLSASINVFLCLIMFLCTFYADTVITIYYRWRRGENLMEAHRSHLYQYMSNELGYSHWKVSLLYAVIQLGMGILALWAYQINIMAQVVLIMVYGLLFFASYQFIKKVRPKHA